MSEPKKTSQAEELLKFADAAGYWFGTSTRGEPFGVPLGESIARPLCGGRGSVRAELARAFAEEHGKAPSANALADTMLALEGKTYAGEERELHLRVARRGGTVWLDLGTPSGELVRITADGWEIVPGGGPLFRRTRLIGPLPKPSCGGDLGKLRDLLLIGDGPARHGASPLRRRVRLLRYHRRSNRRPRGLRRQGPPDRAVRLRPGRPPVLPLADPQRVPARLPRALPALRCQ